MNKVYFHSKNDEQKSLLHFYYILLIFLVYGIYKNGILLYQNNLITLTDVFKPLGLLMIAVVISILSSFIFKERIISYRLICNMLIGLVVMPNISYLIFSIVVLVLNIIYHFIKFHMTSFFMIVVSIITMILHNYSYLNVYEASHTLKYGFLDYLFGKGYGGISNTLLLATIILAIIYVCHRQYKKHILISFLITNIILNFIGAFIVNDLTIGHFINNNVLFAVVFIAPISIFSPYTRGGCYIYGILLSIICFIASFFDINLGLYIGISLLSLLSTLLDKPFIR